MRLKPEQFLARLERGEFAPVLLVSGDDPVQVPELAERVRRAAAAHGFEERVLLQVDKDFDWNALEQAAVDGSLFSNRKLIEVRLGQHAPGKTGGDALSAFAVAPPPDTLLLITSKGLDGKSRKTAWFKAVDKAGATIQVEPVSAADLPAWIQRRARSLGRRLDKTAAELLADRVEGNMLAAAQEVEKLVLLSSGDTISTEQVMDAVGDDSRFDAFVMIESSLSGDPLRCARMLRSLRREGAVCLAVLGAVLWEMRLLAGMAAKVHGGASARSVIQDAWVRPNTRRAMELALRRLDAPRIQQSLRELVLVDRAAKGGGQEDPWDLLEATLLRLAGADMLPAVGQPEHCL